MPTPNLENSRSSERLLALGGDADLSQRSSHLDWSADKVVDSFMKSDEGLRFSNYPAVPAATTSTPFYRLDDNSAVSNPRLAELKETTLELVRSGFIDQKDIEGLSARLQETHELTPADQKHTEAAYAKTPAAHNSLTDAEDKLHATLDVSGFIEGTRLMNLNEMQAEQVVGDALGDRDAMKAVFLHELGHATLPGDKLVKEVYDAVNAEAKHVALPEAARMEAATHPHYREDDLQVLVKEMYADAFSASATYVTGGAKGESAMMNAFQDFRGREFNAAISDGREAGSETFIENHHTSEMLSRLDEKFKTGEAQTAIASGHAHEMIIDVVAKGYVKEYENTRFADLNVHHIENGKLEPGLPAGVTKEQVLLEDARHPMAPAYAAKMTVLVDNETQTAVENKGLQFAGSLQKGGERWLPIVQKAEDIPGFSVFTPGGLDMAVVDKSSGKTVEAFSGTSAMDRYVESHTLAKAEVGERRPNETATADRGSDRSGDRTAERREDSTASQAREVKSAAREQAAMEPSM